ncbi:MAG: bifunctional nuclease family protein [Planctomycetota bacterium]
MENQNLIDAELGRLVIRDNADRQYIYLVESGGSRGFPIVIGNAEAGEIYRVLHREEPPRPLTHQLAFDLVSGLGARIRHADIVDLKHNTFYAQLTLENEAGDVVAVVDARPSDAIALALRARCGIRVAEEVFRRTTEDGSA